MKQKILLINPPFTQLNTPYPATAYLKGFLNTQNINCNQVDLGIETILALFSCKGLTDLFDFASPKIKKSSDNAQRIFALKTDYINSIDAVIKFLQDEDNTLAHFIAERNFLPEASKFEQLEDLDWAFGSMGIRDKARHIATLFLEDISDFVVECVDEHFGFSRYAERLSIAAASFDSLYNALNSEPSFVADLMLALFKKQIEQTNPTMACFSVPFPGNLFATLKCGQWLKQNHPKIKIVIGGGFANTELRSLSDVRVFEFLDFICLDDGETPLMQLFAHLNGEIPINMLKRTFALIENKVVYCNHSLFKDVKQEIVGTPDYSDLPLKKYLSVIQLANPMHRLWSDGRWNKLTMAHGCYWGKCTFCDISLDYIKNYEASSANLIVDRMEELIATTGETGFHFVDEAAPPALMKSVALEILKRKLVVSWWTNIRFEKSFSYDLCRLLAKSGCIAISGGLEVASDRLLKLIAKGVTVKQVAKVNENLTQAGIMVHAYLMYGFPTQTEQETIDALEVVRQMFECNVLQSAFWHRFAMTVHSPVGMFPKDFKVKTVNENINTFANNDLNHKDETGGNHDLFAFGLKKSLYNYMHSVFIDEPLQYWFDHKIPETSLPPDLIQNHLNEIQNRKPKPNNIVLWIGGKVITSASKNKIEIITKTETITLKCKAKYVDWIVKTLNNNTSTNQNKLNYDDLDNSFEKAGFDDFTLFWYSGLMEELRAIGLLVL